LSRELAYLLLICGLLVVPGLLLRVRIPPPLTCFMLGVAVFLAVPGEHHSDAAVHLLAAPGISTLFLYAGLEVNLKTLRQAVGPLFLYLLTRVLAVATAWLAWRYIDLGWQDATLVSLALLTSSTGFIIGSYWRPSCASAAPSPTSCLAACCCTPVPIRFCRLSCCARHSMSRRRRRALKNSRRRRALKNSRRRRPDFRRPRRPPCAIPR
jgi:hypothetical protein